ncbi:MAG: hypothetical protein ACOC16_03225 [Nanoarchaeota archaeon]
MFNPFKKKDKNPYKLDDITLPNFNNSQNDGLSTLNNNDTSIDDINNNQNNNFNQNTNFNANGPMSSNLSLSNSLGNNNVDDNLSNTSYPPVDVPNNNSFQQAFSNSQFSPNNSFSQNDQELKNKIEILDNKISLMDSRLEKMEYLLGRLNEIILAEVSYETKVKSGINSSLDRFQEK